MMGQRGFSLIEIMVTLVILAFGLLSLGMFNIAVVDDGEVARERTAAVHLAEQIMEQWQHSSTDSLPSLPCKGSTVTLSPGTTSTCTPVQGVAIPFSITPAVMSAKAPLPNGGGNISMKNLTGTPTPVEKLLTVNWLHKGINHSIYLTHITRAL